MIDRNYGRDILNKFKKKDKLTHVIKIDKRKLFETAITNLSK